MQPIMEYATMYQLCGRHTMPKILLKLNHYKGIWFALYLMITDHNVTTIAATSVDDSKHFKMIFEIFENYLTASYMV